MDVNFTILQNIKTKDELLQPINLVYEFFRKFMKNKRKLIVSFFLLLSITFHTNAQQAGEVTIMDSSHYSSVFGETRHYRIFLPGL